MAKAEEIFSVEATIRVKREKAILIELHGEEFWLPISQLFDADELPNAGPARVKMTEWIAKEKGLR